MRRSEATDRVVLIIVLSLVTAAAACGQAGRLEWAEVPVPSLAGNLLGSPETQCTAVYLPPSYDSAPARRYPVLYLLHGIFDTPDVWDSYFGVSKLLDRTIASRDIEELMVVMPTGSNGLGGGFYRNSPVAGGWCDFVAGDDPVPRGRRV